MRSDLDKSTGNGQTSANADKNDAATKTSADARLNIPGKGGDVENDSGCGESEEPALPDDDMFAGIA